MTVLIEGTHTYLGKREMVETSQCEPMSECEDKNVRAVKAIEIGWIVGFLVLGVAMFGLGVLDSIDWSTNFVAVGIDLVFGLSCWGMAFLNYRVVSSKANPMTLLQHIRGR